jgi:hypothetical protein
MFDTVSIRNRHIDAPNSPLDLGFFAEAMLFYGHVHVFADRGTLGALVAAIGPDLLIEYLREELFTMTYIANMAAVHTQNNAHELILAEVRRLSLQESAQNLLVEVTGKQGKGRRLARQLMNFSKEIRLPAILLEQGRCDIADSEYIDSIVSTVLRAHAPEFRPMNPLVFDVSRTTDGFRIDTNIDFQAANSSYHRRIPKLHSTLSEALLLSYAVNARSDLYLSSMIPSELAVDPLQAEILQGKLSSVLNNQRSTSRLNLFKDMFLENCGDVRGAINSGARNFEELRALIHKAKRFRHWLAGKSADADLAKEYFREVTGQSWMGAAPLQRREVEEIRGVRGINGAGARFSRRERVALGRSRR